MDTINGGNLYNIILHTTTHCNYNCSYCDVIKGTGSIKSDTTDAVIHFSKSNSSHINEFKFFWWEPLLQSGNIQYIINKTFWDLGTNFEIVTNTSLLMKNTGMWSYFRDYFKRIFFSVDSENSFEYDTIFDFINNFWLKEKVYFNLIVSPWKEAIFFKQFEYLYNAGYNNYNILPIYFSKQWEKVHLKNFWRIMKQILQTALENDDIQLYWFQKNNWYNASLSNESLFIDIDWWVYYSDFVCTRLWAPLKNQLRIGHVNDMNLSDIRLLQTIHEMKNLLQDYTNKISEHILGQPELHKMMDYFSKYLNKNR